MPLRKYGLGIALFPRETTKKGATLSLSKHNNRQTCNPDSAHFIHKYFWVNVPYQQHTLYYYLLLAITLAFSTFMPCYAETSNAATPKHRYADLDWVARKNFSEHADARLENVPAYCRGTFLEPEFDPGKLSPLLPQQGSEKSGQVTTFSNKVVHIPGVSTEFLGNVELFHDKFRLLSESIIYRIDQNSITLPEPITLREPGFLLTGARAFFDLNSGQVDFWDTQYVLHNQGIHGHAKKLKRKADITAIKSGTYTSCPPSDWPIWQLRTQRMKLDATSGWGSAQNARLEVFRVPVLYFPYLQFPIDDRRKTGLLFPSISSSDLGGIDSSLPLYLNLAPNYDATLTPRYIRRRGTLYQGEFRYLNNFGQGALSLNTLSNDKQVIATQQSEGTSEEIAQQLEPDRSYASWNHSGRYGQHWSSHAYAEYASDEEYFHDFGNDFNTSNLAYLNRSATLRYQQQYWQLGTTLRGFQTIDDDIAEKDRPYMQLPAMTLTAHYPLSRHFDLQLTGESTYYIREVDDPLVDNLEGNRLRLIPAMQATFSSPWGHISPRLKVQQLSYSLESDVNSDDVTVPLFSLDTGLFFERDFEWKNTHYRQTLDPRLFYLYAPTKSQNHLPNFDSSELTFSYSQLFRDSRFSGGDRFADYNQLSLGLSSAVSSRDSGEEVFSIALGQAFFLEDPEVRLLESNDAPERSPISGYLFLRPADKWLLNASFSWDGDHNIHEENSFGATYLGDIGQLFNIEFRSRESRVDASFNGRDRSRQSKLSFVWPLSPRWKVLGYWHYNLKDKINLEGDLSIETLAGVQYENCCVQVKILNHRYLQEQLNELTPKRQLRLQIQLKGLANLDDQVSDILQRTIPHYQ